MVFHNIGKISGDYVCWTETISTLISNSSLHENIGHGSGLELDKPINRESYLTMLLCLGTMTQIIGPKHMVTNRKLRVLHLSGVSNDLSNLRKLIYQTGHIQLGSVASKQHWECYDYIKRRAENNTDGFNVNVSRARLLLDMDSRLQINLNPQNIPNNTGYYIQDGKIGVCTSDSNLIDTYTEIFEGRCAAKFSIYRSECERICSLLDTGMSWRITSEILSSEMLRSSERMDSIIFPLLKDRNLCEALRHYYKGMVLLRYWLNNQNVRYDPVSITETTFMTHLIVERQHNDTKTYYNVAVKYDDQDGLAAFTDITFKMIRDLISDLPDDDDVDIIIYEPPFLNASSNRNIPRNFENGENRKIVSIIVRNKMQYRTLTDRNYTAMEIGKLWQRYTLLMSKSVRQLESMVSWNEECWRNPHITKLSNDDILPFENLKIDTIIQQDMELSKKITHIDWTQRNIIGNCGSVYHGTTALDHLFIFLVKQYDCNHRGFALFTPCVSKMSTETDEYVDKQISISIDKAIKKISRMQLGRRRRMRRGM